MGRECVDDGCVFSGYAVGSAFLGREVVESIASWDERWRFKLASGAALAPRVTGLREMDPLLDVETVAPAVRGEVHGEVEIDYTFPEVMSKALGPEIWKLGWASRFKHAEPVHLLEGRGTLSAVKHVTRDSRRHGRRVLVLGDSMCCTLAFSKGRCTSHPLLQLCRRVAAEVLATGTRFCFRWIPSESNRLDKASRQWERERRRAPEDFFRPSSHHEEDRRWEDEGTRAHADVPHHEIACDDEPADYDHLRLKTPTST